MAGYRAMHLFGFGPPGPRFVAYLARRISQGGIGAFVGMPLVWVPLFFAACAAVLGLLGGVMLLLRRRVALLLHWLYALAAAGGVAMLAVPFIETWSRGGTMCANVSQGIYDLIMMAGLALVYPVLVMAWFSRPAVRRHVRSWRSRQGRMASRPPGPIWPAVLGTLALYWGATGALSSSLGLVERIAWPEQWGIRLTWHTGWRLVAAECALLVLAGLSVVWGILLRQGKRAGVTLAWVYAVGGLAYALAWPAPIIALWMGTVSKGNVWLLQDAFFTVGTRTMTLLICPVFLLVWLARPKIRAQVRSWGTKRTPAATSVL